MPRAVALSDAQLELLRTTAHPLPHALRRTFLQRLDAALRGRESVDDGFLWRTAHTICRELLSTPARPAHSALGSAEAEAIMQDVERRAP
jgi:hypothetical protein